MERLVGAEIRIGDNDDFIMNDLCYKIEEWPQGIIHETFQCIKPLMGRYVSIQRKCVRGYLSICETFLHGRFVNESKIEHFQGKDMMDCTSDSSEQPNVHKPMCMVTKGEGKEITKEEKKAKKTDAQTTSSTEGMKRDPARAMEKSETERHKNGCKADKKIRRAKMTRRSGNKQKRKRNQHLTTDWKKQFSGCGILETFAVLKVFMYSYMSGPIFNT